MTSIPSSFRTTSSYLCCILIALLLCQLQNVDAQRKIRGMAFSTGHDLWGYHQKYADVSMNNMRAACVNYVHISAYTRMTSLHADTAEQETDDDNIRYIIRKSKRKGFRVFFKPVVEINGNTWRGFLNGSPRWFDKVYIPYITKMAKIAQQEKVDLFAVGSEYSGALNKPNQWKRVIRLVRSVYKGQLTYVGNHDSFKRVKFWHMLDVISVSAYFSFMPGKRGSSPGMDATTKMWEDKAKYINDWRLRNKLGGKQILIAEVGAQSKGDGIAYREPWDWQAKAAVDFYEQVKMYEGILNAFMPQPWCKGVMLWNWELRPNAGNFFPGKSGYTPQNKPAMRIMKKHYCRWH